MVNVNGIQCWTKFEIMFNNNQINVNMYNEYIRKMGHVIDYTKHEKGAVKMFWIILLVDVVILNLLKI